MFCASLNVSVRRLMSNRQLSNHEVLEGACYGLSESGLSKRNIWNQILRKEPVDKVSFSSYSIKSHETHTT